MLEPFSSESLPPNTAYKKLQEERGSYQHHASGKDVSRHNRTTEDASRHHDESPACKSAKVAKRGTSYQCTQLTDNRNHRHICWREFNL